MKRIITLIFLFAFGFSYGQTANNFPLAPFQQSYAYASNTGYPSPDSSGFNSQSLSQLIWNAGGRNVRPYLPDFYITPYGASAFASDFAFYTSVGYTNMTAFLGGVYSGNSINHTFPGCGISSWLWRGMYDSIYHWDGSIDTSNTAANYIYKTVNYYKNWVKVWEIINEPLICAGNENVNPSASGYWGSNMPQANQLPNLESPLPYYIRLLRIAWTVIKTQDPTAHISMGGMIATQEMKVMGIYTDNPGAGDISGAGSGTAGSITANFPLPGSAYFDVLDEHIYPMFSKATFDNNCNYYGNWGANSNSDFSVYVLKGQINGFDSTAAAAGYNGTTYPKKWKMITEMDVPKSTNYGFYGNDTMMVNFLMKAHIKAQSVGILNAYKYALYDNPPYSNYFSNMGMYKDLTRSGLTISNAPKDMGFYGNATLSTLLYGSTFDSAKTASLAIPSNLDGAAFKLANGNYIFAIWAKTTVNQSEYATGTYTLPTGTYIRYEWNYSQTGTSTTVTGAVPLSASPSFFTLSAVQPVPPKLTHTIQVYSDGSINVQ